MNVLRFFAIVFIFSFVSIAWMILGGSITYRTDELRRSLTEEVNSLWGPSNLVQHSPYVAKRTEADPNRLNRQREAGREPLSSQIAVSFEHHNRYKGLLWFSTYKVAFEGTYQLPAPENGEARAFVFELSDVSFLEGLVVTLDGQEVENVLDTDNVIRVLLPTDAAAHSVTVKYDTCGQDSWQYGTAWPGLQRAAALKEFALTATTDFRDIDYPKGSRSPDTPAQAVDGGMKAAWTYKNLRSSEKIGIEMPRRPDAGPIAARMSFFAPVSLLLFLAVLFAIVVLRKVPLHPMHYLFIAGGFFSFHILLAYLADLMNLHAAFWISAAVSVVLVVTYARLVAGVKFAVAYVGLAQLVYLVGFSYAFLWKGRTGLTVTIGAIATLFVLMQATGKVNWSEVFGRSGGLAGGNGRFRPEPPPLPAAEAPEEPKE